MTAKVKYHWVEKVVFSGKEPQPQPLLQNEKAKIVLTGLEPGQQIPPHPAPLAMYYFIEGQGWMTVDNERFQVGAGVIVQVADGALRGLEAESRLVFIGAHTMNPAHST